MGGALGARNFPFPSAIGGSQNVNPLTQAQAPDAGLASANPLRWPGAPAPAEQSPLIPPSFNPVQPMPAPNPVGAMRRYSPLYG